MQIDILTLFPAMFQGPLTESILKRAQEQDLINIKLHDLKEWGIGNYHQVDDSPYGGGAGMVMRVDVIVRAIEEIGGACASPAGDRPRWPAGRSHSGGWWKKFLPRAGGLRLRSATPQTRTRHHILLTPRGKRLTQEKVEELSKKNHLLLLCGHYEGVDQRVVEGKWIDEEISIGDYVLTGGELPAMVLIDAVTRQIPGVLGKDESAAEESFSSSLNRKREYPHYTRPEEFKDLRVPDVLLSGNHAEIEKWRIDNTKY